MSVILFILILGLLVFVHEFGHFWTARRLGVGVHEFGFGFPPRLWAVRKKDVDYSINLIPFGGFVRLVGENAEESQRPDSLTRAGVGKKLAIVSAGVVMNVLLAWALLTGALMVGITADGTEVPSNRFAQIQNQRIEAYVVADSPAATSGLQTGDRLVSVNGQNIESTEKLLAFLKSAQYPELNVQVIRFGVVESLTITPAVAEGAERPTYGFGVQSLAEVRYPWYIAPWFGLQTTVSLIQQTFTGFGQLLSDLLTRGQVSEDVAGPLGIAVLTGQVQQLGFVPLIQFMAVLSVSLAVINFLPLPALDGGRAALAVVERLRGRPVNPRIEQIVHSTGFYLLILLLIVISVRDVQRFAIVDRFLEIFR